MFSDIFRQFTRMIQISISPVDSRLRPPVDKFGSYKVHLYREHRGHILGLGTMSMSLLMLVSAVFTTYCTARGAVIGIVRSLLLILSIDAVVSGEC